MRRRSLVGWRVRGRALGSRRGWSREHQSRLNPSLVNIETTSIVIRRPNRRTDNPRHDILILNRPPPCRTVISTLVFCRLEDPDDFLAFIVPGVFWLHRGFQLKEDKFDYFRHFLIWPAFALGYIQDEGGSKLMESRI